MLTDSHCHLDHLDLAPHGGRLDRLLEAARARGVARFLSIGIDLESSRKQIELARSHPGVFASAGVHPMNGANPLDMTLLEELGSHAEVIGIGETGLDYHYQPESGPAQRDSFAGHLDVARRLGKPVIVHTREAQRDTLDLIRGTGPLEAGGVLHCFTESREMAHAALDLNFYISFSGILTFRNASQLREVAASLPLHRILVETDAPWLAPVPYRGKQNQPAYLPEVAACLASLHDRSPEDVAAMTSANFDRLFGLNPTGNRHAATD